MFKHMAHYWLVALILCALPGCSGGAADPDLGGGDTGDLDVDNPDATGTETSIGSEGGQLTSLDGRLTVIVPPGAVDAPVDFRIRAVDPPASGTIGSVYRLHPEDRRFQARVILRFSESADARAATYIDGEWQPLDVGWVDSERGHVYGATSHFSDFGTVETDGDCSCADDETCVDGGCTSICSGTDCPADDADCHLEACPPDACDGIQCGSDEICYYGSCYQQCTGPADCSDPNHVCYDELRCANENDPCVGVQCPTDQFCHDGGCFYGCSPDQDCTDPESSCYNAERCADDPCDGIQCAGGYACFGGSCFEMCDDAEDCSDPESSCYDATRCATDPCAGIHCTQDKVCHAGTCFPRCSAADECDAGTDCYDAERCADAACAGVQCPSGHVCYGGSCFQDCSDAAVCTDPSHHCHNASRCASSPCDRVQCPVGEVCSDGTCGETCTQDDDCANTSAECVSDRCENRDVCAEPLGAPGTSRGSGKGVMDGTWRVAPVDSCLQISVSGSELVVFELDHSSGSTAMTGTFEWLDTGETGSLRNPQLDSEGEFSTNFIFPLGGGSLKQFGLSDCTERSGHVRVCRFADGRTGSIYDATMARQ